MLTRPERMAHLLEHRFVLWLNIMLSQYSVSMNV